MRLYDYFRSSASYRVRIALNLKNIAYEKFSIHLLKSEHLSPEYLEINPQGRVPALEINGNLITQSLAIIEYLEDVQPEPPLLPSAPLAKAEVRSLALLIACDIHPLNNSGVLNYLRQHLPLNEKDVMDWYFHWLKLGLSAFEKKLINLGSNGDFCFGNKPSLADICLIPQVYNAERFNFNLNDYPIIRSINARCLDLKEFSDAIPVE